MTASEFAHMQSIPTKCEIAFREWLGKHNDPRLPVTGPDAIPSTSSRWESWEACWNLIYCAQCEALAQRNAFLEKALLSARSHLLSISPANGLWKFAPDFIHQADGDEFSQWIREQEEKPDLSHLPEDNFA